MKKKKAFLQLAGSIFATVALLHALRVGMEWDVILDSYELPPALSLLTAGVAGTLAYALFYYSNHKK